MSQEQPFDELDDPGITQTDADVTSETRFGPRPVPQGHRRPSGPTESRRILPHGDVSPDGRRGYPQPSRLAKWAVWGGTGVAAAALTAGTVYAARHLADLISGRDDDRPHPPRPEVRESRMQFASPPATVPVEEPRRRAAPSRPKRSLAEEIEANTATLSTSVDNVMRTVTSAVAGFRGVAEQATTIVREFGDAADLVRDILERRGPHQPRQRGFTADPTSEPADRDPRSHRL